MSGYIITLSTEQKNNATVLVQRMRVKTITNPFSIAAILAIVSKESNFIPHAEASYRNTPNDRIRLIFGRLHNFTDDQINKLKLSDLDFFNAAYGGMYGDAANEGFKFRGAGYHQITFEGNFKKVGDEIGVDLVNHPELLDTDPKVAADELIQFFEDKFVEGLHLGVVQQYHTTSINGFTNATDAVNAVYHSNAGWGKTREAIDADPTGGKAKATSRMSDLVVFVNVIPNA